MKKVILLIIISLFIFGCESKPVVEEEKSEYIIYQPNIKMKDEVHNTYRSYNYATNELIDQKTIDKISKKVELYPAYYLYDFGKNQRLNNKDWKIEINSGSWINKQQNDALPVRYYVNCFAIVPYLHLDTLEPYITHKYTGQVNSDCLQVYAPKHYLEAFNIEIGTEYSDNIE